MTRYTRITLVICFILGIPQAIFAGLRGSSHDFSNRVWSGGELCRPCHKSHNGASREGGAPLWNRSTPTQFYRVYNSLTFRAAIGQPGGVSILCLSCHDGVTALDAYGGKPGTTPMGGKSVIGLASGDHHPVSFIYDGTLAAATGNLSDPATTPSGLGGTIAQDLLRNSRVECTSCHDTHNINNNLRYIEVGGGTDALCDICHIDGH